MTSSEEIKKYPPFNCIHFFMELLDYVASNPWNLKCLF